MNTTRLQQARRLFSTDLAPKHVQRHNMRQWARQIRRLGTHWQLHPQSTFVPEFMR